MRSIAIHIPFDLARYATWQRKLVTRYETNRVIKALDTWLILKAETRSSLIQDWNQQRQHLLTLCKCSDSIFRSRLKLLRDLQLLQFDRYNIQLCSWQDLGTALEIDIKNKFIIQYDPDDKKRVQDWIIATEIKDNQQRQAYKVIRNVNKNPELNLELTAAVLKAGADRKRIQDPAYFLSWLQILYREDFIRASEIHDLLISYRPDTNRGVRSMADSWKCKSPSTVSYWKRVLQTTGIVHVSKLQIESQERVRNEHCKVLWIKKTQQTLLCLCDHIEILTPWLRTTLFKDNTDNENISANRLSAS